MACLDHQLNQLYKPCSPIPYTQEEVQEMTRFKLHDLIALINQYQSSKHSACMDELSHYRHQTRLKSNLFILIRCPTPPKGAKVIKFLVMIGQKVKVNQMLSTFMSHTCKARKLSNSQFPLFQYVVQLHLQNAG